MPLKPSEMPKFSSELTILDRHTFAVPQAWNPIHQTLLDNDAFLNERVGEIDPLSVRMANLEQTSAVGVRGALILDWQLRSQPMNIEMFEPGFTLIDISPIAIVQGVSGDDSLDVQSTTSLKAGESYVLLDSALDSTGQISPLYEPVEIASVLSDTRIRLVDNMNRAWGPGTKLVRSALEVIAPSTAVGAVGAIYISRKINVGEKGGAVVVRRTLSEGKTRLFYRDAYQRLWRECDWSLRRQSDDVPPGFADYEYILPMRGPGNLRIDVAGEPITIKHLVALGAATGLGGYVNPDLKPTKPTNITPNSGGVMERPTLTISSYSSPSSSPQAAIQFQIATSSDFATVKLDTGSLASGLAYPMPSGVLTVSSTYWWRARVQDSAGLWSEWSTPYSFITAASFAYTLTPSVTAPSANAQDVPEQPTLSFSPFAVSTGTDTYASVQVRIRSLSGVYEAPVWDSGEDTVNRTTMQVPAGKLQASTTYCVQARQKGSARGWSEWSSEVRFTTKAAFASVIGMVLVQGNNGGGTWARIDESGNNKGVDASFFGSHPVFGGIVDQIIDQNYMVKIPAFYVKRGNVAGGVHAGKKAFWISDQPGPGFELHPAFRSEGNALKQFWVGKYQGTPDGPKMGSKPYNKPITSLSFEDFRTAATARNVSGITGFGIWSVYQLGAIQTLMMIEMGGSNSQQFIGKGITRRVAGGPNPLNVERSENPVWRGIVGLWGNACQFVDGVRISSVGKYEVWDRNGLKDYMATSATPMSAWTSSMADVTGTNYDLRDVFLPTTASQTSGSSTYADYSTFQLDDLQTKSRLYGGIGGSMGQYGEDDFYGLFSWYFYGDGGPQVYFGSRLSKI